jgi:hypothetical protein
VRKQSYLKLGVLQKKWKQNSYLKVKKNSYLNLGDHEKSGKKFISEFEGTTKKVEKNSYFKLEEPHT